MSKKTLVLGASEKTDRYSNKAIRMLKDKGVAFVAHGNKAGNVEGVPIFTNFSAAKDIHTVTLYLSVQNQTPYLDDIVALKPERVIFNPGTANHVLEELLKKNGIAFEHACTLVLLSTNSY